jgi:hypothetical protein
MAGPKITAAQKERFLKALEAKHGKIVSRQDVLAFAEHAGIKSPQWLLNSPCKVDRGRYDLSFFKQYTPTFVDAVEDAVHAPAMAAQIIPLQAPSVVQQKRLHIETENVIPPVDPDYVAFGFHNDLTTILRSRMFYPVFISGLSGNGKTTMVEQICAKLKREVYRVNISVETDEDSLVGGHTLVDGNVVYREGPALLAMRRGAVLLLDEVDRGSNKLICLQAILEGKPFFNKKTGEVIHPADGFTVVATANTKGQGSDDGKFSAAQILDEAFLERFAISYEQQYAPDTQEKKIIINKMKKLNCVDEDFASKLIVWSGVVRKTYEAGGINDVISTRRLVNIVQAFALFQDKIKAIELCVNRFDPDTREQLVKLYTYIENPTTENLTDAKVQEAEGHQTF